MTPETISLILAAADPTPGPRSTKHEVIGVIGDLAICFAWHLPPFKDAAYTGVLLKDGQWKKTSHYYATADTALLGLLGHKHEGSNGRFGQYAAVMLGLDTPNRDAVANKIAAKILELPEGHGTRIAVMSGDKDVHGYGPGPLSDLIKQTLP